MHVEEDCPDRADCSVGLGVRAFAGLHLHGQHPFRDNVPLLRKPEGGSLEQAIARGVKSVATVHQKTVVPHDHITDLPRVFIDEFWASRMGAKVGQ